MGILTIERRIRRDSIDMEFRMPTMKWILLCILTDSCQHLDLYQEFVEYTFDIRCSWKLWIREAFHGFSVVILDLPNSTATGGTYHLDVRHTSHVFGGEGMVFRTNGFITYTVICITFVYIYIITSSWTSFFDSILWRCLFFEGKFTFRSPKKRQHFSFWF